VTTKLLVSLFGSLHQIISDIHVELFILSIMKIIQAAFIFILFISIVHFSYAQVYLGGGRNVSAFSPSGLDQHSGYGAIIQRQFYLKESKFSFTPTLQGSVLTQRQYFESTPEFYSSVSMATHLNYDVISTQKFRLTPFVGPAVFWITGLKSGGILFDSGPVNFYRLGLDMGVSMTYIYSDNFSVKFIPLTYTRGNREFVQGNVLSFLFQIK